MDTIVMDIHLTFIQLILWVMDQLSQWVKEKREGLEETDLREAQQF
jgi:hypothetical protein|tara:strand:+ start:105 stop:242 length:138 start_codon:yes stop_codon:yes gene_type:complete